MPEYIERETTVRMAVEAATEIFDCHTTLPLLKVANKIRTIPTADVVEVVRCKDCEFYKPYYDPIEGFYGQCLVRECDIGETDYCSYGERKEGAEE